MMVNIGIMAIDKEGRVTIPANFLRANGIFVKDKRYVAVMKPKYNSSTEVSLEFIEYADVCYKEVEK